MTPSTPPETWRMFDRIAGRYDLLNRLLSFRRDVAWRKRLLRHLPNREGQRVLDLATGTADVLLALLKGSSNVRSGIGLDMSGNMLKLGKEKISESGLDQRAELVRNDAVRLSLRDESFDAASMAFGIRNVSDVDACLREIHRVLAPGGRTLILEFSTPSNPLFRPLYLFYFRQILPRIGGLISGDPKAYRYLNESAEEFPYGEDFVRLMEQAGFIDVKAYPLTLGIATLYQGDKAERG